MIAAPILLFSDECTICKRIGHWVQSSSAKGRGTESLIAQPIGNDPKVLRALNPDLDIWDAYANIHVLMPDGTMKLGGEAVAEVLRDLPNTMWFAWTFRLGIFGFRPFQVLLDLGYAILSDARPLLGCSGCGVPARWVQPILLLVGWYKRRFRAVPTTVKTQFTPVSVKPGQGSK